MDRQRQEWTFLTNHARVLLFLARNPTARVREVATACRITERTAQRVVADLEQAGYLSRERVDQRTEYTVDLDTPLRHPAETGLSARDLFTFITNGARGQEPSAVGPAHQQEASRGTSDT